MISNMSGYSCVCAANFIAVFLCNYFQVSEEQFSWGSCQSFSGLRNLAPYTEQEVAWPCWKGQPEMRSFLVLHEPSPQPIICWLKSIVVNQHTSVFPSFPMFSFYDKSSIVSIDHIIGIILTFRHRASCILGQAFHYSLKNAFYIFNQQIYFIIWYLLDRASLI